MATVNVFYSVGAPKHHVLIEGSWRFEQTLNLPYKFTGTIKPEQKRSFAVRECNGKRRIIALQNGDRLYREKGILYLHSPARGRIFFPISRVVITE